MDPQTPYQILVLGDFSGRGDRIAPDAAADVARRRPIPIDRERLDAAMARLGVHCEVSQGGDAAVSLHFAGVDDFHPDRLAQTVPQLAELARIRQGLQSPAMFDKAAAEVRAWGIVQPKAETSPRQALPKTEPSPPAARPLELAPGQSALDIVLGQAAAPSESGRTGGPGQAGQPGQPGPGPLQPGLPRELAELVRRTAEPFRVEKPHPDQADLVACVDAVAGQLLRTILHDPGFQALEAAWRGLAFLVRGLPTGARLKVFLLDVSLAELAEDFRAAPSLESSGISKLLVDATVGTPGGEPWAVVAAHYQFNATSEDLLLAACLSRICARAGATLLAGAGPTLIGCESLAATPDPDDWRLDMPEKVRQTYDGVRSMPDASHLGLVLPRFLLRLPYGSQAGHGSAIESFPFEEMPGPPAHASYLWGNPALACAYLLGRGFVEHGWAVEPQQFVQIDGLPAHGFERDGQYELQPCAEVLLSDRAALQILEAGVMPLLSIRGANAVRLGGWRSLSGGLLAGRGTGES